MTDNLTQSEIDALLSAVSTGDVPAVKKEKAEPKATPGNFDWIAYDLASQEKFLQGRLVALDGIHERFCRLFRATLIGEFNNQVSVTYKNTEVKRFGDFLGTVSLPSSLNVLRMNNPPGYMIFEVGSKLAYALVDGYYGGSERPFSQIGTRDDFTKIEKNLIKKVIGLAISDLKESWKPNYPVELELLVSEPNPVFVSYIHSTESVAVVNFEVEFENSSGILSLVVHLRSLDSIRQFLSVNVTKEISSDKNVWETHWRDELVEIPLEVCAKLGHATATLEEISNWKEGDVITLDQDPLSPLSIEVEGIPTLTGQMGVFHGSSAVRINEFIKKK